MLRVQELSSTPPDADVASSTWRLDVIDMGSGFKGGDHDKFSRGSAVANIAGEGVNSEEGKQRVRRLTKWEGYILIYWIDLYQTKPSDSRLTAIWYWIR